MNTAVAADTANWLAGQPDRLHKKLAAVQLVSTNEKAQPQELKAMLDAYIERRTELKKPGPRYNLERASQSLCGFFGPGREPGSINAAEAADFRRCLVTMYVPATVSSRIKKARQLFADAMERKLIS